MLGLVRRIDGRQLAADPLYQEVVALGRAVLIPAEIADQRVPGALVQGLDDRGVVDRAGLGGLLLEHHAGRIGFGRGGVDAEGVAAVHRGIGLDKGRRIRVRRFRVPVAR